MPAITPLTNGNGYIKNGATPETIVLFSLSKNKIIRGIFMINESNIREIRIKLLIDKILTEFNGGGAKNIIIRCWETR